MKIVVDTNCIISALLKDGASRELLRNRRFDFFTPETAKRELERHKVYMLKKGDLSEAEFELVFDLLFERIAVVQKERYKRNHRLAKSLISDIDDAPFIALALAEQAIIWSDDKHFLEQDEVKVLTTREMINPC